MRKQLTWDSQISMRRQTWIMPARTACTKAGLQRTQSRTRDIWRRQWERVQLACERVSDWFAPADPMAVADLRAKRLLLRLLSEGQREELNHNGYFSVNVQGRGVFCIFPRTVFNVLEVRSGDRYCCVSAADVPLWDLMLAQKLMLENDPSHFFSVANRKPDLVIGPQEMHQLLSLHARRSMGRWAQDARPPFST